MVAPPSAKKIKVTCNKQDGYLDKVVASDSTAECFKFPSHAEQFMKASAFERATGSKAKKPKTSIKVHLSDAVKQSFGAWQAAQP